MTRECHVRICGGRRVRSPPATRRLSRPSTQATTAAPGHCQVPRLQGNDAQKICSAFAVISDPSTCVRTERADCARVHSRRRWLTMSSAGEGRQNRSPASRVTPAALGLSSELRSPGLPREGGRALAPPCPGNGRAVVLGENGLVRRSGAPAGARSGSPERLRRSQTRRVARA